MILNTLVKIAKELNKKEIKWAVASSILMNHYGLVDKMNDIDIIVSIDDVEETDLLLGSLGKMKPLEKDPGIYTTKIFHEYIIDEIDVDMMAGFGIRNEEGIYEYDIECRNLDYFMISGEKIYYSTLEDWYILYQLIGNREEKVSKIESYLLNTNCNKILLKKLINKQLPNNIKERSKKILEKG